jgi:hypothetical protein
MHVVGSYHMATGHNDLFQKAIVHQKLLEETYHFQTFVPSGLYFVIVPRI